jgi:FAD/FMN-containing dehydrogenase
VPALTAAPGDSFGEVYAVADANRVVVVGGSEISVSACGGYTLGGGHSWMGPAYGMAVDNALRVEVVLAGMLGTVFAVDLAQQGELLLLRKPAQVRRRIQVQQTRLGRPDDRSLIDRGQPSVGPIGLRKKG